jgi:hypothetical protein
MRLLRNVTDRTRAEGDPALFGGHGQPQASTFTSIEPAEATCIAAGAECFHAGAIDATRAATSAVYRIARQHYADTGHMVRVETVTRKVLEFY